MEINLPGVVRKAVQIKVISESEAQELMALYLKVAEMDRDKQTRFQIPSRLMEPFLKLKLLALEASQTIH